jgi:hypothetical protein
VLALMQEQAGKPGEVAREQARIEEQLGRLKRLFALGDLEEREYLAERDRLRAQLAALTPPAMLDLERATELLQDFGAIWDAATLRDKKKILHTLLENVELDAERGPVAAIKSWIALSWLIEARAGSAYSSPPVLVHHDRREKSFDAVGHLGQRAAQVFDSAQGRPLGVVMLRRTEHSTRPCFLRLRELFRYCFAADRDADRLPLL